ncbi:hypothetical protein ACU1JV_05440 [Paenibacillus sp. T2-29]
MTEFYQIYFKDLIPLISVCIVVLGWIVNYNANRKQKLYEVFLTKTELNITEILGPMYQELRNIFQEKNISARDRLLKSFVEKYRSKDTPLFLSTETEVLSNFRELQLQYDYYKLKSPQINDEKVWMALCLLDEIVDKKISEYRNVIFKHYNWYYILERSNPILAFCYEIFRKLYVTVAGLSKVSISLSVIIYLEYLAYLKLDFFHLYFVVDMLYILPWTVFISMFWIVLYALNWVTFRVGIKKEYNRFLYNEKNIEIYKKKYPYPFLDENKEIEEDG